MASWFELLRWLEFLSRWCWTGAICLLTLSILHFKELLGLLHVIENFEVFEATIPNHLGSVLLRVGDFNNIDNLHARCFFLNNFKCLHLHVQVICCIA